MNHINDEILDIYSNSTVQEINFMYKRYGCTFQCNDGKISDITYNEKSLGVDGNV